jgi:Right handed beta helix region
MPTLIPEDSRRARAPPLSPSVIQTPISAAARAEVFRKLTIMRAILLASSAILFAAPALAHLPSVYPDCAPIPRSYAHVWHVDLMKGSTPDAAHHGVAVNGVMGTADGSSAHPFNSLQGLVQSYPARAPGYDMPLLSTASWDHYPHTGVHGGRIDDDWVAWVAAKPDPTRINPGDQVVVHGGASGNNYGDLKIGYPNTPYPNVDWSGATVFVDFVAAPGETKPLLTTVSLQGMRGFIIEGFNIVATRTQGLNTGALVNLGGVSRDIIIQNNYIGNSLTKPDWTNGPITDTNSWRYNERPTAVHIAGPPYVPPALPVTQCMTVVNNTIEWTGSGIGVAQSYETTIDGNHIQYFVGDGIDNYSNSDATISNNWISDAIDDGSGIHADMIQFAYANMHGTFHNVVVKNNYLVSMLDPNTPYTHDAQGIDATNETWDHMTVTGNVVVTNACLALNFGSATNSQISNNTVVNNGLPGQGCDPYLMVGATNPPADFRANNIVRNNIVAGQIIRHNCTDGSVWAGNIQTQWVAGGKLKHSYITGCQKGVYKNFGGVGSYDGVIYDTTTPMAQIFKHYAPPATGINPQASLDLSPAPGGLLDGTGIGAYPR